MFIYEVCICNTTLKLCALKKNKNNKVKNIDYNVSYYVLKHYFYMYLP